MNEQWEQENAAFLNGSLLREKAAIRCAFDYFFEEGLAGGDPRGRQGDRLHDGPAAQQRDLCGPL